MRWDKEMNHVELPLYFAVPEVPESNKPNKDIRNTFLEFTVDEKDIPETVVVDLQMEVDGKQRQTAVTVKYVQMVLGIPDMLKWLQGMQSNEHIIDEYHAKYKEAQKEDRQNQE